ncbi:MAG: VTT domain-containing protein [Candidatus Diapherotrites archaeon]|uniref:VTT domain-containing protein n=1 Tax=Candidatus Iainarchaeum sp. TaxID=3101447 RepID=A0A8T4L3D5_9ARCH|nr:VTT domain-containing protein [Candidatus Diapherotrites archaeon]
MVLDDLRAFSEKLVSDALFLIHSLVLEHGVFGYVLAFGVVMVVSIIGNATIFLPAPVVLLVFGSGAFAAQYNLGVGFAILMGIAGGIGAAIGEMSSFFVGYLGQRGVRKFSDALNQKLLLKIESQIKKHGNWIVFLGALSPLPFDVFGLAAGVLRMDAKKFFAATLVGKIIRDVLIALAGYYGLELLKKIFVG